MISAEYAITRFRRDVTLGALVRLMLIGAALICLLIGPFVGKGFDSSIALFAIGMVWLVLSFRSARGSQLAQSFPSLIAAGQYEVAEQQIERSLRAFSLFKGSKLLSLHHLAMLRHAQNRYQESAMLCRAVLGQRPGTLRNLSRQSRLILADALLELGELNGTYETLARLHQERLSLAEAMKLLGIELDYLARVGAWSNMMSNIRTKIELAELMPTNNAARAQAFLALAAKKLARRDWENWLRRRVELLVDVQKLIGERPMLKELWGNGEK